MSLLRIAKLNGWWNDYVNKIIFKYLPEFLLNPASFNTANSVSKNTKTHDNVLNLFSNTVFLPWFRIGPLIARHTFSHQEDLFFSFCSNMFSLTLNYIFFALGLRSCWKYVTLSNGEGISNDCRVYDFFFKQ